MNRILKFGLYALLLVLAVSCSQYKYETVPNDPTNTRIYTLDNGLKVYMSVTKDEINAEINEIVEKNQGATADKVKEVYGEYYFEYLVVSEKVADFLFENAKIK